MEAWWSGLGSLNQGLLCAAVFFTVLFIWQMIGLLLGMDIDHGTDAHDLSMDHSVDAGVDHGDAGGDSHGHHFGGEITFSLVSVRSILAFGMLFSWAGALYLMSGTSVVWALVLSLLWGLAAMFLISFLIYKVLQLQETGNLSVWTAVGEEGIVYINLPKDGVGKVRVMVSGTVSFVNAKAADGEPVPAGARVRVTGVINENTLEVKPMEIREEV